MEEGTGVPIIESYGLTEASPGVTANPLNIEEWTGTIGMPLPSTQATILDEGDNELRGRRGRRDLRARPSGHAAVLEPPRREQRRYLPAKAGCALETWGSWTSAAASR